MAIATAVGAKFNAACPFRADCIFAYNNFDQTDAFLCARTSTVYFCFGARCWIHDTYSIALRTIDDTLLWFQAPDNLFQMNKDSLISLISQNKIQFKYQVYKILLTL